MSFIADTHVHLYPCYDLDRALRNLAANLARLASDHRPAASLFALLTERNDCHFFSELRSGALSLPDIAVAVGDEEDAITLKIGDTELTMVAGRQIVTSERVEILSLCIDVQFEDGQPAADVIKRIQDAGGLPVLSWAPGKWMFERENVIRGLFENLQPGDVLAGDTTLRPLGWIEPGPMRKARQCGFNVIAGSDPLPFAGDEVYMGTYASAGNVEINPAAPMKSLREAMVSGEPCTSIGHRCSVLPWLGRLRANAKVRSRPVT